MRGRKGHRVRAARRCPVFVLDASLAVAALTVAAGAATADTNPTKKVPAHFAYLQAAVGAGCGWSAGLVFPYVKGAIGYRATYWDGYYSKTETTALASNQFTRNANKAVPKGDYFISITGGNYPGACTGDFTGEKRRFDKGAQAWAILPLPAWSAAKCQSSYRAQAIQRGIPVYEPSSKLQQFQLQELRQIKASLTQSYRCKFS